MQMSEMTFGAQPPVDSYGPGGFRIADSWHPGSLLLTPGGVQSFVPPLSLEALKPVLDADDPVDVVLIGTGADIAPLPHALRSALEEAGFGVEVMASPAACRTYNVLLVEARRVAAVLVAL